MVKPAIWQDDPECGHSVACAYQTHYCTYIRVPRLLSLQAPEAPEELLLITSLQWFELWFQVLLGDLGGILADQGKTYETAKLLHRGSELFKLFDSFLTFAESTIVRELKLTKTLRSSQGLAFSAQFGQLGKLARHLDSLAQIPPLSQPTSEYLGAFNAFRTRYNRFLKATLISRNKRGPSFSDWLCLPELLDLKQGVKAAWAEDGKEPETIKPPETIGVDETMFIVVHQCFELWFKVVLDHMDRAIPMIASGEIGTANRLIRHVVAIERLLVHMIEIPATMLPLDFARFRFEQIDRDGKTWHRGLSPASGTESYQFREIEIAAGLRDDGIFREYLNGNGKLPIRLLTPRQEQRLIQPTLADTFRTAVQQRGIEKLDDLFTPALAPNPNADLTELANTLVEFDEAFHFWRVAHVSMVEKMIGAKSGTGFLGPEYLKETAGFQFQEKNRIFENKQVRPRFFPELWQVRTRIGVY